MVYDVDALTGLKGDDLIVAEARERFKRCQDWEANYRPLFTADNKFAHGDSDNQYQWPDNIQTQRDDRPCLTINKTRQHNLQIINDGKRNKPQVKVRPVGNGATFEAAQVYEGVIRHIEYNSNAQSAYDTARTFQVNAGVGYWRVITDYANENTFDQEIFVRRIKDPLSVYLDPDIVEKDGSDARYGFIFDDMPIESFKRDYPDYLDSVTNAPLNKNADNWIDDKHVRVAEYYRAKEKKDELAAITDPATGEITYVRKSRVGADIFNKLKADGSTKFRDIVDNEIEWFLIVGDKIADRKPWAGKYIPIVRIIGEETVIEGKLDRKGHTRALKDAQRMYNYNASAAVEYGALQSKSPYVAPAAAIEGYETYWNTANTINYSILPYNHVTDEGGEIPQPERAQPPASATLYLEAMQTADQQMMMASGQYEADFGRKSNEVSGKAINARAREGDDATYHFIDNEAIGIRFTGKIFIDLIPKIYDTKRIVKILAEDGTETDVQLDPQAQQAHQQLQEQGMQKASIIFNPNVGEYDVEADIGPAYATKREEAFNAFQQIASNNPEMMNLVGDLLFKNADFPGADEIAERFKDYILPKTLGTDPQLAKAGEELKKCEDLLHKAMEENVKLRVVIKGKEEKRDIEAFNADTNRIKALGELLEKHYPTHKDKAGYLHDIMVAEHEASLAPVTANNEEQINEQ